MSSQTFKNIDYGTVFVANFDVTVDTPKQIGVLSPIYNSRTFVLSNSIVSAIVSICNLSETKKTIIS